MIANENPAPPAACPEGEAVAIVSEVPLGSFPARMPMKFGFRCFGIPFAAVAENCADGPTLSVAAEIRPLPFSAESAQARHNLVAILVSACPGAKAKFVVGERQEIQIVGSTLIGPEPTPERLIAAITAMLFPLKPYFDLMEWFGRLTNPRAAVS